MDKKLLQDLIDSASSEFRMIYDDAYRKKVLGYDIEIEYYLNMAIDPRVQVNLPGNATLQQREEARNKEIHDTIIRYYGYPFEFTKPHTRISDQSSRKAIIRFNGYVDQFNFMVLEVLTDRYNEKFYRTEDEIKGYLASIKLPTTLEGLNVDRILLLRKKYPYAWFDIDIPLEQKDVYRELEEKYYMEAETSLFAREKLEPLNDALNNNWTLRDDALIEHYKIYMGLLNDAPPLPNPIVLFRGMKREIPQVGDEIIEYGFSSKSYIYWISNGYAGKCCVLIISYPKNHKFYMPQDKYKSQLFEIVSYPGEVLKVDKIESIGNATDVYCHFVRYEPHVAPDGKLVTPILTNIFKETSNCGLIKSTFYNGDLSSMTTKQLDKRREDCKLATYKEGHILYVALNSLIMNE